MFVMPIGHAIVFLHFENVTYLCKYYYCTLRLLTYIHMVMMKYLSLPLLCEQGKCSSSTFTPTWTYNLQTLYRYPFLVWNSFEA
jgi:hypothetical protein